MVDTGGWYKICCPTSQLVKPDVLGGIYRIRKKGAAKVLLKPAAPGTGIRSGGAMRAVVELSGVKDMITKSLGTNNPVNTVRATIAALQALQTADSVAQARGKPVEEMERLSRRGKRPEAEAAPVAPAAPVEEPVG